MNKNIILILILVVLLGGSWILYVKQAGMHQEAIEKERAQSKEWERNLEQAESENAQLRKQAERTAQEEAKARKQAEEAERMAKLKAEEEHWEREQRVAELNERLIQEADERRLAEAALRDLANRMKKLSSSYAEAQAKLEELEKARANIGSNIEKIDELENLKGVLAKKDEELANMKRKQEDLQLQYEEALERQIATGEEIIRESSKSDKPGDLLTLIGALLEALGLKPSKAKVEP